MNYQYVKWLDNEQPYSVRNASPLFLKSGSVVKSCFLHTKLDYREDWIKDHYMPFLSTIKTWCIVFKKQIFTCSLFVCYIVGWNMFLTLNTFLKRGIRLWDIKVVKMKNKSNTNNNQNVFRKTDQICSLCCKDATWL